MNLQEQTHRIKEIMGLLTEGAACETWKDGTFVNGDGINTPKITINNDKTKIEGVYEGPESGFCIQSANGNYRDTIHQLATIAVFHEGSKKHLKNLYKSRIYVRPDLKNITLDRRNNYYKITIPLTPTTEDKAITSINQRGSMGGGTAGIDYTEYDSVKNTYPEMFYDQIKTAGDMTEHFFAFRNLNEYPILTKPVSTQQPQQGKQQRRNGFEITGTELSQFIKDIPIKSSGITIDEKNVEVTLDTNTKNYSLKIGPGTTKVNYLRLALNVRKDKNSGTFPLRDEILKNFPGARSIKDGTFDGGGRDYSIIMIP